MHPLLINYLINAFNTIIEKLTSSPVLGFANPQLYYVLHTDASTDGLVAALYQEQEGKMCVWAEACHVVREDTPLIN